MNRDALLNVAYPMKIYPVECEGTIEWCVEFPDLPGCVAGGDTLVEALEMAEDAKRAWIEIALEDGKQIPEPSNSELNEYSGKFTLRLPKTLHRDLATEAETQGVSLNQYILFLVTKNHYQTSTNTEYEQTSSE